jgi:hypothetical protein
MTWRETLVRLKHDLTEVRAQRQQQAEEDDAELQKDRDDLNRKAEELSIQALLTEMNTTLLEGKGELETVIGWESSDDDSDVDSGISLNGEEPDDDDGAEVITTILSWDEGGEMEIAVDLGLSDDGIYLQINEIEIRPEREALEQGLVEAFRDELEL